MKVAPVLVGVEKNVIFDVSRKKRHGERRERKSVCVELWSTAVAPPEGQTP